MIYPLLAGVLGASAASSVSVWLVGSASPFYNLAHVGMIAVTLVAIHATRKRLTPKPSCPVPESRAAPREHAAKR